MAEEGAKGAIRMAQKGDTAQARHFNENAKRALAEGKRYSKMVDDSIKAAPKRKAQGRGKRT
jgi:hypothetical protein